MGFLRNIAERSYYNTNPCSVTRTLSMADPLAGDLNGHDERCGKIVALSSAQQSDKGKTVDKLQNQCPNTEHHMTEPELPPQVKPTDIVVHEDEFFPLSGTSYFHCILSKSNVEPKFQMTIPVKIQSVLPPATVPVVLTFRNKNWEMNYYGDRSLKCFGPRWKFFATDNDLKIGDGCVFDLMENDSKIVKFRVQILRGDIPDELLCKVDGESSETPIIIE